MNPIERHEINGVAWQVRRLPDEDGIQRFRIITGPSTDGPALLALAARLNPGGMVSFLIANQPLH